MVDLLPHRPLPEEVDDHEISYGYLVQNPEKLLHQPFAQASRLALSTALQPVRWTLLN
mgnify:CR=1 FL=1